MPVNGKQLCTHSPSLGSHNGSIVASTARTKDNLSPEPAPAPEGAMLSPQEQLEYLHKSPQALDISTQVLATIGTSGHPSFAYKGKHHSLVSNASRTAPGSHPEGRNQGIMHTLQRRPLSMCCQLQTSPVMTLHPSINYKGIQFNSVEPQFISKMHSPCTLLTHPINQWISSCHCRTKHHQLSTITSSPIRVGKAMLRGHVKILIFVGVSTVLNLPILLSCKGPVPPGLYAMKYSVMPSLDQARPESFPWPDQPGHKGQPVPDTA